VYGRLPIGVSGAGAVDAGSWPSEMGEASGAVAAVEGVGVSAGGDDGGAGLAVGTGVGGGDGRGAGVGVGVGRGVAVGAGVGVAVGEGDGWCLPAAALAGRAVIGVTDASTQPPIARTTPAINGIIR
jgi:hypothetical protein